MTQLFYNLINWLAVPNGHVGKDFLELLIAFDEYGVYETILIWGKL